MATKYIIDERKRRAKIVRHNDELKAIAIKYSKDIKLTETAAENKFYEIALKKKNNLERQYRIDIYKKNKYFERFYFADFCDVINKLVFEVDGGYHFTEEQHKKDIKRTNDLKRMGYKVFRISNSQIKNGKTTQFLIECYKTIGINI